MNTFDIFCHELLEQSKRFNEKGKEEQNQDGIKAYRNASLLLCICALEAYINGISEEITLASGFPLHESGILLEKEVKLEKGRWVLSNNLKISRLTDKIELLYARHTQNQLLKESWWQDLRMGIDYRNKITHPKEEVVISSAIIEKVIKATLECLSVLYKSIYKRDFPKPKSIVSKLDF